ncbi:septum formation family protein [Nocardioides terrisoli]|uniref:septum formation family protein n=1 Tax=Nocardioides terrisoli TaxID=3388267 RepID=UPI00287B5C4A|nr:septum formation family protein [Nocardioides marmorisolisilvae]
MDGRLRNLGTALAAALLVVSAAGCTSSPSSAPSTVDITPTAQPRPAPPPRMGSCHRLGFRQAMRPTAGTGSVPCSARHTSVTMFVGTFDPVVDGHLMAVDSGTVQKQLADRCPRRLTSYVGGTETARRLSRLTTVWFGPTVAQADLGARWFRCDLVALRSDGRLAPLDARMRGVLDHNDALSTWGTCGTTAPSARGFQRVVCSRPHQWRAVDVVPLPAGTHFLGRAASKEADSRCHDIASARAGTRLKFTWSFEWPTRQQWDSGQRYGYCWLPES